jgi:hypothetical protein
MQETSSEDIGALGKLLENPSPERGGETGVSALGANAKQHVSVGSTAEFDRAGTSASSTHVSKEESSSRVLGGFFDIHQREPPPVSRWPWSATHGSASGSQSTCPGSDETKNGGEVARDAKEAMQSRTYTSLGGATREVLRGSGYGAPVKDPLAPGDFQRSTRRAVLGVKRRPAVHVCPPAIPIHFVRRPRDLLKEFASSKVIYIVHQRSIREQIQCGARSRLQSAAAAPPKRFPLEL